MSEISRDTLMAYLDKQLDLASRATVEADAGAMAEVSALQRQSDAIRTLYGPAGAEPVPARLDPHRRQRRIDVDRPARAIGEGRRQEGDDLRAHLLGPRRRGRARRLAGAADEKGEGGEGEPRAHA